MAASSPPSRRKGTGERKVGLLHDGYHPDTVFSSIDAHGRYAYGQQPGVAAWNLAQLATALLPLMGGEAAIPEATAVVRGFADTYGAEWARRFAAKLGSLWGGQLPWRTAVPCGSYPATQPRGIGSKPPLCG